jgi:hypothetical protein
MSGLFIENEYEPDADSSGEMEFINFLRFIC